MTTLVELNTFSDGVVSYTDARPSNVIFNFPSAVDLTDQDITTTSFTIQRTIDIVEIVQPAQALVSFKIDVSSLSGATVSFPGTTPSGVAVSSSGGIYTVSGIDSISDWIYARNAIITLPSTVQGSFFYRCTILYTNDGTQKTQTWEVGNFKAVAALQASSSLSLTPKVYRDITANPIAVISVNDVNYELAILGRFAFSVNPYRVRFQNASITSTASIDVYSQFSGLNSLTYTSNQANGVYDELNNFSGGIFENVSFNDTRSDYGHRIDFDVSHGYITNPDDPTGSLSSHTFIYSTVNSNINDYISKIQYWPTYNYTGDVILRIRTAYNGISVDDFKVVIAHGASGSITTQTRTWTTSTSFTVPVEEVLYGSFTALVVGGGGGGINTSGGGGGGVIEFTPNITSISDPVNNRDYTITVGAGGAARELDGGSLSVNCFGPFFASSGGTSSAFGAIAYGGQGGQYYNCYNSSTTVWDHEGGDSGASSFSSTSNSTNAGYGGSPASGSSGGQLNTSSLGGGGAGAGGDATSQYGEPGSGVSSSTFGDTYGPGGWGASAQHPSAPTYVGPGRDPTKYGGGGSYGNRNGGASAPSAGYSGIVRLKVQAK